MVSDMYFECLSSFNGNYIFQSDREEEETIILLWNFLQLLDYGKDRKLCIYPVNKNRDIIGFNAEMRAQTAKFYNYCRISKAWS